VRVDVKAFPPNLNIYITEPKENAYARSKLISKTKHALIYKTRGIAS